MNLPALHPALPGGFEWYVSQRVQRKLSKGNVRAALGKRKAAAVEQGGKSRLTAFLENRAAAREAARKAQEIADNGEWLAAGRLFGVDF